MGESVLLSKSLFTEPRLSWLQSMTSCAAETTARALFLIPSSACSEVVDGRTVKRASRWVWTFQPIAEAGHPRHRAPWPAVACVLSEACPSPGPGCPSSSFVLDCHPDLLAPESVESNFLCNFSRHPLFTPLLPVSSTAPLISVCLSSPPPLHFPPLH